MEADKEKLEIWKACKIVEEDENGKLQLLQDNLDKLQRHLRLDEYDIADLNIISVIGARENENAFLTNLLRLYLKKNGKRSWSTSLEENGLEGFAFGTTITKEDKEMTSSSTKDKEENLLQKDNISNQQDHSNEINSTQLKEDTEEQEMGSVRGRLSQMNLDDDQSTASHSEDKKDQSSNDPSPDTSKVVGISRKQQILLYKIISKLIVHAGVLQQSCGDELSNTTKDLYTAAQRFEEIPMNGEDDKESGVEDFEIIDPVSVTFADFVTSSEALIKHYQTM